MINCEYCEYKSRSQSGMAMHVRAQHNDKWNGSLKTSFSEGFDMGQREPGSYHIPTSEERKRRKVPALVGKGQKKPPIKQSCPWCDYKSIHPPGLAHHIKAVHPKKWKGRLSITLGKPMTTSDKYLEKRKADARKRSADWREARKQRLSPQPENSHLDDPREFINCCPKCGEHLAPYYLAARAAVKYVK